MKIKVILLATIFILSFTLVNCEKSISPFAPEIDIEEQSEDSVNTGSVVSAKSNTKDSSLVKEGKKGTDFNTNPDVKGDSRIDHVPSGNRVTEKNVGNKTSDFAIDNVNSVDGSIVQKKSPDNRGVSRRKKNEETNQGLYAQIQPFRWNTNWEHSEELVTVRILGEGFENIAPASLRMVGPEGDETGEPYMSGLGPDFVAAKFLKSKAIGIIPEPNRGDTYEIQVAGKYNDDSDITEELFETVFIVGNKSEERELSLEIKPNKWNLAWGNDDNDGNGDDSENVVTARISGEGFDEINPGTIQMDYPDGGLGPINPIPEAFEFGGVSFVIKFTQGDTISLILDPKRDDAYEIHVTGNLTDGTPFDLTYSITIVGKKQGEGELSLEIKPNKWNIAWANGNDDGNGDDSENVVTARIKGEKFDEIDPTSIQMSGPAGTPITPENTEVAGFSFIAKFLQSKAITSIPDPPQENSYDIHVTGNLTDGTPFDLSYSISIKGKKK